MLVNLLHGLEPYMEATEESGFLQDMLTVDSLNVLIKLHERLRRFRAQKLAPVQDHAEHLAHEIMMELHAFETRPDIKELIHLFSKPDIQELLSVHDAVAQKDYEPKLPALAAEDDEDEEDSVRIIRLMKSKEPLGATIKRDESTGAVVVARIMRGGAADRSGLIREGDELKEINGVPLEDPEMILPILAQSDGAVTFKVLPGSKSDLRHDDDTEIFVRARFDYHPKDDPAIPCKDAGLEFRRGDVLQIVSREDDVWWQARRIGDDRRRTGLIPSRQLQEKRATLQRPEVLFQMLKPGKRNADDNDNGEEEADYVAIHGIHTAGLRRSFRLSKKDRRSHETNAKWKERKPISSYQEVVLYTRQPGEPYRLVLLVGPRGVGVTELTRKLVLSDPEHFGVPVPHTTREPRKHEKEGVNYHFVSKHAFEKDILDRKFIGYGRHAGNYYGTAVGSVRRVLAEGKVCLLDVEPHAAELLYAAEFKPYVTFVRPPAIEQLRVSRRKAKILAGCEEPRPSRTFMEADFEGMIKSAQEMENEYGYLFENAVMNDDLARAFTEVRAELEKLEKESSWIPKIWIKERVESD